MATVAVLLLSFICTAASLSTTTTAAPLNPSFPPSPDASSSIATILSTLGFQDLAAAAANFSGGAPATIFAPTDSSLLTCPSCSIPLLLHEHSLSGLYTLHFLRQLAFGTKIETLAPNRCLTITASPAIGTARKVFINGVEIIKPDLFNNGLIIVHALQGFVSHLSPLSCAVETMTSLSYPHPPPHTAEIYTAHLMLKEAMTWLRTNGYSIVGLAMRVNYPEISGLKSMTLFAIDDESIFVDSGGGQSYLAELGFHIVPNRLLTAGNLTQLLRGTTLPTIIRGRNLVVTSAGDGGPLAPMMINYVKVREFNLVVNQKIVVHGVRMPFRRLDFSVML